MAYPAMSTFKWRFCLPLRCRLSPCRWGQALSRVDNRLRRHQAPRFRSRPPRRFHHRARSDSQSLVLPSSGNFEHDKMAQPKGLWAVAGWAKPGARPPADPQRAEPGLSCCFRLQAASLTQLASDQLQRWLAVDGRHGDLYSELTLFIT